MADLLTVETVARYLGLDEYSDEYDTIGEYIDQAQAVIERYTNRSLATAADRTEYYTASGRSLYVQQSPITTIYALTDDVRNAATDINVGTNVIDSTDDNGDRYARGKIELWDDASNNFTGGQLGVRVWYNAGWTAATIPDDLLRAWIDLACFWFNNQERLGLRHAMGGGALTAWQDAEIPQECSRVFKAYRLYTARGR